MDQSWMSVFPDHLRLLLAKLPGPLLSELEEIRVREGRPLEVNAGGRYQFITPDGGMTRVPTAAYKPDKQDTTRLLDLITNHSLYTMEEELRKGFITLSGGHRVGLSGRTVLDSGRVEHLRDISGFNIRLAREIIGIADPLISNLLDFRHQSVQHTLILSPPQQGKTTLIRDLARQISGGSWRHPEAKWAGKKVAVIDERSEIAGSKRGVPSFDLGPRTDVMDGCPKSEGMMMMIRSMSPEVLVVDEIGRPEDVEALAEALHAGVRVIATAHGTSVEDLESRPALSKLVESSFFQRFVVLSRKENELAFHVWDGKRRRLLGTAGKDGDGHV